MHHPFITITSCALRFLKSLLLAVPAAGLAACSSASDTDSTRFADDEDLAALAVTVDSNSTRDTTFVFGGNRVPTLEIERIFPTEHDDVYISLRVFALDSKSEVNVGLSRIISENYSMVSGGDVYYSHSNLTARSVENEMDNYGRVFVDTILPMLKESVEYGFFMNMDLRPAWTDGKEIMTYSSFVESSGGATCYIDAYYVSFGMSTGKALGFSNLVPDASRRLEIRRELVDQIARSHGLKSEQYLYGVTAFRDPDAIVELKADDFPVEYVARMGDSLIFSYRQGSIAPFSEGCPIYRVKM